MTQILSTDNKELNTQIEEERKTILNLRQEMGETKEDLDEYSDTTLSLHQCIHTADICSDLIEERVLHSSFVVTKPDLFNQVFIINSMINGLKEHLIELIEHYDDDHTGSQFEED